jgi:hypothetical protein
MPTEYNPGKRDYTAWPSPGCRYAMHETLLENHVSFCGKIGTGECRVGFCDLAIMGSLHQILQE